MRAQAVKKALVLVAIFCIARCWAVDGTRINGRAVSAHWRFSMNAWATTYNDAQGYWDGAIDLFTINGGRVVKTDTIFKAQQGLCYNPAFDINGCKVAFYRLGRAMSATTSRVTANGGVTTISVMNIDGSGVTNLCNCPGEPHMDIDGDGGLDWPAGDWIYYLKPVANGGYMRELWKVNVNTKENVNICSYDLGGGRFRRLSFDLAANKIGSQVIDGGWFTSDVDPFPNGCTIASRSGGCNSAISPSGNYSTHFMGDHTELILEALASGVKAPPPYTNKGGGTYTGAELTTFQAHCPDHFGIDVEGMGFACNSDKWILQHVGWYGHAEAMENGSEQVACNWADMVAIRISNNGKIPQETCPAYGIPGPDCCGGCGKIFYGNEFGDLWVDGGAANAGKYEDGDGSWHSVAGAGTAYCPTGIVNAAPALPSERIGGTMKIAVTGCFLEIFLPASGAWRIDALDSKGRIVTKQCISGVHGTISRLTMPKGMCVIRAHSSLGDVSRTVLSD